MNRAVPRRSHRMYDDGVDRVHDLEAILNELEEEVTVLSARDAKPRVESPHAFEHPAATEAVRGDEVRALEARNMALVVGRVVGKRDDDAATGRVRRIRTQREYALPQPVTVGNRVVVRERDHVATRDAPPGVPHRCRAPRRRSAGDVRDRNVMVPRHRSTTSRVTLLPASSHTMISNSWGSSVCKASASRTRSSNAGR